MSLHYVCTCMFVLFDNWDLLTFCVCMYICIYVYVYIYIYIYICNSYNTGKSALPDIYARRPRASAYISGKARVPVL